MMSVILYSLAIVLAAPVSQALPQADASVSVFALVLGQNQSDSPKVPTLRYADDDAVATHRLLLEAGVASTLLVSLDPDSLRLYPELASAEPPTKATLLSAFTRINQQMTETQAQGEKTEFLFFYSGHGSVERGEGYIVLSGDRLRRSELYEQILAKSAASQNHVFVDACKSYYLIFDKGPGGERIRYPQHFVDRSGGERFANTGFVLSTSSDRDSHEWERFQAGIFSYEIRSALRGGADLDGDGQITYAELGAFLSIANQGIANPLYRPDFVVRAPGAPPGDLSVSLLRWNQQQSPLLLDLTALGHVYLENARGERLLDVHPDDPELMSLHVPPERPIFIRQDNESQEWLLESTGSARLSELKSQKAVLARKGALHLAFEQLFAEPFGKKDLAAYQEKASRRQEDVLEATIIEQALPRSARSWIQETSQWTALGSAALGVSMNLWAVERQNTGKRASQEKKMTLNQEIHRLNIASGIFYGLAGAAAATWLALTIWPGQESSDETGLTVSPLLLGSQSAGLGLSLKFFP